MENTLPAPMRKWVKKCLEEEFEERVNSELKNDRGAYVIADEIIHSSEMEDLVRSMKESFASEKPELPSSGRMTKLESRRGMSLSFGSEDSVDDWSPFKSPDDQYAYVIEKISYDKPVHVRLAGYERLLENELSNVGNSESWDILLKTLGDGIADESRPVFEASLRVHAKLLESSRAHDVYTNLLGAFNAQYHAKNLQDTLPSLNTGINFKIFLHEKLFRLMRLIVYHLDEVVKGVRAVDRTVEEMIDQFVVFLSSPAFGNSMQSKTLDTINVLSVIEPQANWSKKWIHGLATRKTMMTAIGKSPSFLENLIAIVSRGLENPPGSWTLTVTDEPPEVFISGETVETATYLHGLNFLAQLTSYSAGRDLLSESPFESSPSFNDFAIALLSSLNTLASTATSSGVYNASRQALCYVLQKSTFFSDGKFYEVALNPFTKNDGSEGKIWSHTLDTMNHMLESKEGVTFLTGDHRGRSVSPDEPTPRYPIISAFEHISKLLRQPFSVMNIEHVVDLFHFVGRAFRVHEVHGIMENTLKEHFFPAVAYLYSKMGKYAVGHENKTQYLDSAAKSMLLKIVASPIGLRTLVGESLVFGELIRGSIAPLRAPWNSSEIVGFVSSAAYFDLGSKLINDLAPQSLSTALEEVSAVLEDPHNFHDPWDNQNLEKFLHVLSSLSLSTRCFIAFMADSGDDDNNDEYYYPRTLRDLIKFSANVDSPCHYLGLLTINAFVWNIDIYIYLLKYCNFQDNMLELQKLSVHEIEEDGLTRTVHVIDSCSLLRHRILKNCYFVKHKLDEPIVEIEDCELFTEYPPANEPRIPPDLHSSTELSDMLENSKPGLRDSGWVLEVRKAYKNSSDPMKNSVIIQLLDQMEKAIPTAEWVDNFKWESGENIEIRDWSDEENLCFDLALRYANENCPFEDIQQAKDDIKTFFQEAHKFINYVPPENFEGFDWFLATTFIICQGKKEKCKKFIQQIIKFPSAMFMWPIFGLAIDHNNDEEMATQCLLGQHLEDVIDEELSIVNWALKNHCGVHWWMICNRLVAQCFWGILPWNEILHFIAICILHSADYIVYYCVSLLNHCQTRLMEDMMKKKMWPDHMYFGDYRCHHQMSFIDRIGKRYCSRVLPTMTQRKLISTEEE